MTYCNLCKRSSLDIAVNYHPVGNIELWLCDTDWQLINQFHKLMEDVSPLALINRVSIYRALNPPYGNLRKEHPINFVRREGWNIHV